MRHIIINNEKITLQGKPVLSTDGDSEYPYYDQLLSNGKTGQHHCSVADDGYEDCDTGYLWVDGEEYSVEEDDMQYGVEV